ncbi:glycosyl hydrolase [Candidatus Zixiibacteriota bacterium]
MRRYASYMVGIGLMLVVSITLMSPGAIAQDSTDPAEEIISGLSFRSIGPAFNGGRVLDLAVDKNARNTWYAAVASGGVWKTVNAGTTWEPIFDDQGSYSISTVVIDPKDSHVIWVGTGENNSQRSVSFGDGVYRSRDGGKTWRNMGLERSEHIGKILIDPNNSNIVYVAAQGPLWADGGDRGLYRTWDGGESWKRVLHVSDQTGITDIAFDPRDSGVIYASSYQRRRHVGILIAGGPESSIFKSIDGGDNWREIDEGLPTTDRGRIGIAVSPQRPDVIYATVPSTGENSGFYRSENGGEAWERMSDWVAGDPQYYQEIFCDPHRFDRLWAEAVNIMSTEDGGRTWEPVRMQGVHVDHHHVGFDSSDPDHIHLGNDGGLYESFDGGVTWRFFSNMPIAQYYRVAVDDHRPFYRVFGGTQDNGTHMGPSRTRDAAGILNDHWLVIQGGDGFQARVDPDDPDIVYSESQYAGIRRANLATGETWGIKPPDPEGEALRWYWDSPLVVSSHVPERIYFAANYLFRSDDRGESWTAISPDLTRQLDRDAIPVMGKIWPEDAVWKHVFTSPLSTIVSLDESPLSPGLLVAGTDDGLIQVTADGGGEWVTTDRFPGVPEFTYVSDVEASSHDPNTFYATFQNHKQGDFTPYILKSIDRGRSWLSIRGDLPDRHVTWSIAEDHEDPELLFAGTEFGVFATVDGGNHWVQITDGIPVIQARDLAIQMREDDLVVGTFGRGFYILDDYSPLRHVKEAAENPGGFLFPVADAIQYRNSIGSRGSRGAGNYAAPNPPYGAIFTLYLSSDASGDRTISGPGYEIVIRNEEGVEVSSIPVPSQAGLQRIVWDLREQSPDAEEGRRRRRGSEVNPGAFTARLEWDSGEQVRYFISESQTFRVTALLFDH